MAEAAVARLHADLQVLRVSEIYRSSPGLEEMPLPRFRLPDVTIDIPVLIDGVSESSDPTSNRASHSPPTKVQMMAVLAESLDQAQIEIEPEETDKIASWLTSWVGERWGRAQPFAGAMRLSGDLGSQALPPVRDTLLSRLKMVREEHERDQARKRETELSEANEDDGISDRAEATREPPEATKIRASLNRLDFFARLVAVELQKDLVKESGPPSVRITTETRKIREVDDAGTVTRLTLTLKEDGFEVVRLDRGGVVEEKWVPE